MKIKISFEQKEHEFYIRKNLLKGDEGKLADALAQTPEMEAIFKAVGAQSGYRRYENDYYHSLSQEYGRRVVEAYFSSQRSGDSLLAHLNDGEEYGEDPELYYLNNLRDDFSTALNSIIEAASEVNYDFDADIFIDALRENQTLKEYCIEAMEEHDQSEFADQFNAHDKVELSFSYNLSYGLSPDDVSLESASYSHWNIETLVPNQFFIGALKQFNVKPSSILDYYIEKYGVDLRANYSVDYGSDSAAAKRAARWQLLDNLEKGIIPSEDYFQSLDSYEAKIQKSMAQAALTMHDASRPSAFTVEHFVTVINNSTKQSIPVFSARYAIKDILRGALDNSFVAKGGFMGMHDFINGAGYLETNKNELLVKKGCGDFYAYSVDGPYDNVSSYYDCTINAADPIQDKLIQIAENVWRTEIEDVGDNSKRYVEIIKQDGGFLLKTFDANKFTEVSSLDMPEMTNLEDIITTIYDGSDNANAASLEFFKGSSSRGDFNP